MPRPAHLPDYGAPPLNEVVVGIQFRPAQGYQQIRAGEVWALFKERFPVVEEQQRLAPAFETFGAIQVQRAQLEFVQGAEHDRFWFVTEKGDELVQFQSDRLLHNWRQRHGVETCYPRFDSMADTLREQAQKLERYFSSLTPQTLEVNQCEASYINHFSINEHAGFRALDDYLNFINLGQEPPDDMVFRYRRTILGGDGKPTGRLYCDANVGITPEGKQVIMLTLTARGAPAEPTIESAISYLSHGRELIVKEFTAITTDKAHQLWERIG